MTRVNQHVLIVDNATTCSMRLKVLVQIHGVMASIVHWSDWEEDMGLYINEPNCMVIVEESVPKYVVQSVVRQLPNLPLFLLFDGKTIQPDWDIDQQINPLSSTLSNFELITLLEPYWTEEKEISLPTTLILDDSPELSFKVSQTLADANVPCHIANNISIPQISDIDLVLVNIADYDKRTKQIEKITKALENVSLIVYGTQQQLTRIEFVHFALQHHFVDVMTLEELNDNWLNKFYRAWRYSAEEIDKKLVSEHIQKSLDHLLEKNLVLKVLFETSLDGVVSFYSNGQIMKMNAGFADLLGTSMNKLIDGNLFERLTRQSKIELKALLISDHLIQQQVLDLQLAHEHKVSIPVSVAINQINFHGQSVFVAVMRNNTNQQLKTKLLVQKNSQLEHQVKNAEIKSKEVIETSRRMQRMKNSFMAKFTEYLASETDLNHELVRKKIDNVNLYFRIESGEETNHKSSLVLSNAIKDALEMFSDRLKQERIAVKMSVVDLQKISFVPQHLTKVLFEVISNAIEYSPQGGVIEIKQFVVSLQQVELTFMDTGMGILDHKHSQLFDMYEANLAGDKALKTGLPTIKNVLKLNGGDIRVENNLQFGNLVGTSFILTFPVNNLE